MPESFAEYAEKIWKNEPYVSEDRLRWHSSGYHIKQGQLSVDDLVEDAAETLDIIPKEIGIPISIDEWQENYMDDPRMVAAMAKVIYGKLKKYGRYAFDEEPDLDTATEQFLKVNEYV